MHIALCNNNKTLKMKEQCKKEEKEILPLATSLDMFSKNFLEVAWYLAANAWCGLDNENVFKIRV
jgi:hypothetical protein